jgi:predicted transcriptional regulator
MSKIISFRIDDSEYDILSSYAKEYDATISWAARRAVKEFTAKLAKESENNETRNYLLDESNDTTSEDGAQSSVIFSESKESKV